MGGLQQFSDIKKGNPGGKNVFYCAQRFLNRSTHSRTLLAASPLVLHVSPGERAVLGPWPRVAIAAGEVQALAAAVQEAEVVEHAVGVGLRKGNRMACQMCVRNKIIL